MIRSRVYVLLTLCLSVGPSAEIRCQVPAASRVEPIGLLRLDVGARETDHVVRGVVNKTGMPLFIQDRTGGMEVSLSAPVPGLHIGDEVLVKGRLSQGRYSSRLSASDVRVLNPGVPDPAVSVTVNMAASGNYDRMFVETEGVLREVRSANGARWLLLDGGRESFVAELPVDPTKTRSRKLDLRSVIRVRGICIMDDRRSGEAVPFTVIPRSADDVKVVSPPPFWNRTHVLEVTGCAMALGLGIMMLYVRMERWRFKLVLDERTRMAHDLHDTLAQSFTGIAFQLQAVRNAMRLGALNLEKQVDLAIGMVSHCQEDARRSIAMLKPADLDAGSVLENLRQQGEVLTRGGNVRFSVDAQGDLSRIPHAVEDVLLRIGHEAITNAIRHAAPSCIAISLQVLDEVAVLEIRDDGCGFVPAAKRRGGFGLRAMNTRAHSYGGTLEVSSSLGAGTLVRVSVPSGQRPARLMRVLSNLRKENNRL